MRTAIIGSGPSLNDSGKGKYIDSFDTVFRFPNYIDWQNKNDVGTKTSYYCCTMKRSQRLTLPLECGCFIWSKYKNKSASKKRAKELGCIDVTDLICRWQKKLPKQCYPYFSCGTAAVCIAMDRIKDKITVLGCDMLKSGDPRKGKYIGSWVYEDRRQNQSHHSFDEERKLIDKMSDHYNVEVCFE